MAEFQEHNNRTKAKKFAEYITGEALRLYVADKVKKYVGEDVSIFDGAAGSGQLEQFINPSKFVAVEIQEDSCKALKNNYSQSTVHNMSFFQYQGEEICDCTVMNPPFSLKYSELPEEDKTAITEEFNWKKNGVVDDIFVLKGLKQSKRWGIFILFPGVGYRKGETKFRELIGNQIVELNKISNAFEDTQIDVLFLVIDKEKTEPTIHREFYDCKTKTIINQDVWEIEEGRWEMVLEPEPEKEIIDPIKLEMDVRRTMINGLKEGLDFQRWVAEFEGIQDSFNTFCDEISGIALSAKFTKEAANETSY